MQVVALANQFKLVSPSKDVTWLLLDANVRQMLLAPLLANRESVFLFCALYFAHTLRSSVCQRLAARDNAGPALPQPELAQVPARCEFFFFFFANAFTDWACWQEREDPVVIAFHQRLAVQKAKRKALAISRKLAKAQAAADAAAAGAAESDEAAESEDEA